MDVRADEQFPNVVCGVISTGHGGDVSMAQNVREANSGYQDWERRSGEVEGKAEYFC